MAHRWISWTGAVGLVASVALAGCGVDDESADTTTTTEAPPDDDAPGADEDPLVPDPFDLDELGDGSGRVPSPDDARSPEEVRVGLVDAGFDCTEVEEYDPSPGDADLGVAPSATFGCEGPPGAIEIIVAADETDIGRLFVLVESTACAIEQDLVLTGEGRWLGGPRDEGDVEVVAAVAEVLGTELLGFDCG